MIGHERDVGGDNTPERLGTRERAALAVGGGDDLKSDAIGGIAALGDTDYVAGYSDNAF